MARHVDCPCSRRDFLVRGMYGIGVGGMLPLILGRTSAALSAQALQGTSLEKHPNRILVVVELSGGNDGLNTVVPFGDPAYYRRFGFVRADELGLLPPPQALYDWAFQVAVLDEDAPLPQGRVVYPPTFPG